MSGFLADRPCQVCGAAFTVTRRHNAKKARFCSNVCSGRASHGLGPRDFMADMRAGYERYVIRRGDDECWDWSAFKHKGYGRLNVAAPGCPRRIVGAHRVSYQLHVGQIPNGLTVLHVCDNPGCTNPRHLRLGTNADNNADRDAKGRAAFGERHHSKLTEADVIAIRTRRDRPDAEWAELLGVSVPAVQGARIGRSWKHLNESHPPRAGIGRWGYR